MLADFSCPWRTDNLSERQVRLVWHDLICKETYWRPLTTLWFFCCFQLNGFIIHWRIFSGGIPCAFLPPGQTPSPPSLLLLQQLCTFPTPHACSCNISEQYNILCWQRYRVLLHFINTVCFPGPTTTHSWNSRSALSVIIELLVASRVLCKPEAECSNPGMHDCKDCHFPRNSACCWMTALSACLWVSLTQWLFPAVFVI